MINGLKNSLLKLKEKTDNKGYDKLNKKLKKVIDGLKSNEEYSMEDLGYLLDLAGLYRGIALKITKFLWCVYFINLVSFRIWARYFIIWDEVKY